MKTRLLAISFLFLFFTATELFAEKTIDKMITHELRVNTKAKSWDHVIRVPEELAMKGYFFVQRHFTTVGLGTLVVVREELKKNYYYLKVRLPKHYSMPAVGSVKIILKLSGEPVNISHPAKPTDLKVSPYGAVLRPIFTWKGGEKYAALTLLDTESGKTIFERAISLHKSCFYDESAFLKPNHSYIWAVKQANAYGKYGKEVRVEYFTKIPPDR
ncbi:hypothetical protein ACFL35_01855 [Candidatus Riflebacteria bacterium]